MGKTGGKTGKSAVAFVSTTFLHAGRQPPGYMPISASQRSASSAAMQPEPAAVTA